MLGAGGLGSPAALYLAAAGVGTIGIIDMDVVDESNLHRQVIHGTKDIGKRKTESARETLVGEPEEIYPFLGSSRLVTPIDTYGVSVVFHGHAHIGSPEALTPAGVPVFNVAQGVTQKATGTPYRVWTARAPDRRHRSDGSAEVR